MALQKTPELNTLLKNAKPHLKAYVLELEKANAKLQRDIVKLEVKQVTLNNRVKALEQELKKHSAPFEMPPFSKALQDILKKRKAAAP